MSRVIKGHKGVPRMNTLTRTAMTAKKCDGKQNSASLLLLVAMETVFSHAFELLHNGQEMLTAFLDVALLFF